MSSCPEQSEHDNRTLNFTNVLTFGSHPRQRHVHTEVVQHLLVTPVVACGVERYEASVYLIACANEQPSAIPALIPSFKTRLIRSTAPFEDCT